MKLWSLYSNDDDRFPRIDFQEGLNVVFARVRDPGVQSQDSHNLGKTFLIRVLDFVLLGSCGRDHAFRRRADLFEGFEFFLEMKVNSGAYVTIKRPVTGRAAICIHLSAAPRADLRGLRPEKWSHRDLGVQNAIAILSRILNLTRLTPYGYRKGLGYVLRDQADYSDEFRISRFRRGRDVDWKPFVALLLGFDHDLVAAKYEEDRRRTATENERRVLEQSGRGSAAEIDELRGVIGVRTSELERVRSQVEAFDFVEIESAISRQMVRKVERRIAELNEARFILEREAQEIDRALATEFGFDLERIKQAFAEAEMALPGRLVKSYEELIAFNERMSAGRRGRLRGRRSDLSAAMADLDGQLETLNDKRVESLKIITQRETLKKFRALQHDLLRKEGDLVVLRQRLGQLGEAARLATELRRIEKERLTLITAIQDMVGQGSERYEAIRTLFSEFAQAVLAVLAVLATRVNNEGNLDFHTRIVEEGDTSRETAEAEGTSYKKALCVGVDLALLVANAGGGFYRFVYHDGVFEGFDNRRKVSLLRTVRQLCAEYGLQYVLTVIDADLPRDERDNKVLFTQDEIIRELHDQGVSGRLFRMEAF